MLHRHAKQWLLAGLIGVLAVPASAADETDIVLAEGEGRERVQAVCSMCHSLDYIVMNSPFQDRAAWEKTVRKMVNVMGAPLTEEDVAVIVNYLASQYGERPVSARNP
ncbi:MAG: cytochrome c [Steroidobacteraceae bacterium]